MAIAKEIWEEIKAYFESGKNPSEITQIMNDKGVKINRTSIVKKSQKECWDNQKFTLLKNNKVNCINSLIDNEKKIHTIPSETVKNVINELAEKELNLKQYAQDTQLFALEVMRKASKAAEQFIDAHPDGTYLKSDTIKGQTFGLVTEVISHIAPMLNGATAITKDDKPTTAIQINNEQQNDKVTINIIGE